MIADLLTLVLVPAGAAFFLAGTVGLLRFPDPLSRLHALTKADSLGLGLIALGLVPQAGSIWMALKLLLVWLLVIIGSTAAGQMLARFHLGREAADE
ncbi:cation:proton antiporter [Ancylobacter defluvii]|uniref:Cation:proton antiporter n=1 Tax=Ancylobacter defluvii TaxID=1282440 RepID=A0A9W6K2F3_9HYPH|nr:monovalent cation/H(+) antiporter subunit G [Ancylobacter defluvii]MBS7588103.1 monovalent cation/H(+) antiporter subunit G [Ancylobacter defluvii]GLK86495.1 cation:proton antiporter [Ancylobacter defluvii]